MSESTRQLARWIMPVAIIVTLAAGRSARADGIPAYLDDTGWHLLPEETQQAVIAHSDGVETLLLQVSISGDVVPEEAERLVWVTPVPAPASEIEIDILQYFPTFWGRQPDVWLLDQLRGCFALASVTQIYPIVPLALWFLTLSGEGADEVVVHGQLSRFGVTVEKVSAPSVDALRAHP